jgi:hypothetical protein
VSAPQAPSALLGARATRPSGRVHRAAAAHVDDRVGARDSAAERQVRRRVVRAFRGLLVGRGYLAGRRYLPEGDRAIGQAGAGCPEANAILGLDMALLLGEGKRDRGRRGYSPAHLPGRYIGYPDAVPGLGRAISGLWTTSATTGTHYRCPARTTGSEYRCLDDPTGTHYRWAVDPNSYRTPTGSGLTQASRRPPVSS